MSPTGDADCADRGWYAAIVADPDRQDVSLHTLHDDLTAGFGEMRADFSDLKATLIVGFRSLPSRESSDEMIRLLREANRLHEDRLTPIDLRLREQHLEAQQVLHAVAEGLRLLVDGQRSLHEEQRRLSADIRALVARLDALIKGRGNGNPTT